MKSGLPNTDADSPSTLIIKVPKNVSDSLNKFNDFFADMHKFVKGKTGLKDLEKITSFELHLHQNFLHYRIVCHPSLNPVIKSLLYSKFNEIEITEEKTTEDFSDSSSLISEFGLKRSNFFPLKFKFTSDNDPYIVISAVLSKLKRFKEGVVLQLVLEPTSESWTQQFLRERFYFILGTVNAIKVFIEKPFLERDFINTFDEVKKKFKGKQFYANLRLFTYGETDKEAKENFELMKKALDKFNNGDVNSLVKSKIQEEKLRENFFQRRLSKNKILLNNQEAAAIFHFPDAKTKISGVDRVSSKEIEPPKELPTSALLEKTDVSAFGIANFRNKNLPFGIQRNDRDRHLYVVGKTGMGKSKLIELLAISDISQGKGVGVIDPHGDLATNLLKYIPKDRIKDVVYFNPADAEYPVGFNPLECHTPESKHQVVTGFIAIFKKLFAANWTNRLEHMMRFTVLALLETKDSTVIDIAKLLTDINFRQEVVAVIKDPVVKNFWTHEFAAWNEKFDNEAIIPIINQVGQFIANDYIRNVVGQAKSAIDFYQAMNEGKIIIINIAKGRLGEENSSLLGSMIITKIQEATMARVNLPENQRREFYLYVDEFQNFATESFNQILSEARKFNLSITIAHQYIDQLSENIRKTVFGNVGSLVCFRLGSEDAHFLKNEFSPLVSQDDLVNLDFRKMYVKLSIEGKTSAPFSASTITVPKAEFDFSDEIIQSTRDKYAVSKKEIEGRLWQSHEVMDLIAEEKSNSETKKIKVKASLVDESFEEPLI